MRSLPVHAALRLVLRLLPGEYRRTRGEEIADALAERDFTTWEAVCELASLAGLVHRSWLSYLRTGQGFRGSLFVGALAWFGLLVAFGPVGRVIAFDRGQLYGFYEDGALTQAVAAAALLCLAFVVVFRSRVAALLIAAPGIVLSAMSIRAGQWQLAQSLTYELSWVGCALALAVAARRPRAHGSRAHGWPVGLLAAMPGLVLTFGPFGRAPRGPGFWSLTQLNQPTPVHASGELQSYQIDYVLSQGWIVALLLAGLVIALLGPWYVPAISALILPALVHVGLLERWPSMLAVAVYLAAAAWLRASGISQVRTSRRKRFDTVS